MLAAIAISAFTKETRKSRGQSEVAEVFAELSVREEQFRAENGGYLGAPACPATPATQDQDPSACLASGQPWQRMRMRIAEKLYCSYEVVAGDGTGATDPLGFSFTSPDGPWFYAVATCELDGQPGTSRYFFASNNTTRQAQDEGR